MLLSIVIPVFNEELVLRETHRRVVQVCQDVPLDYECIFVDDGSTDGTPEILKELQQSTPGMKVIRLSRNYGHQIAITAGLEHAAGDAVVVLDCDLQDPPEVIGDMVKLWQQGHKVVHAQRSARLGEPAVKSLVAKWFSRFLTKCAEVDIPLDVGDFRLMDRKVVEVLKAMPEHDRFVRGLVSWIGFRQARLTYRREARFAGSSKYSLTKLIRLATDGIFSFTLLPVRVIAASGFLCSLIAVLGLLYALILRVITKEWISGVTLIFLGMLFLGGIQLISLGVIGEYGGRAYFETKRRPLYIVEERLGFGD